jgi:hypothetical protein
MPGKKEGQEGGVAKEAVKGAVEGMGVVGAGVAERYVFLRLFGGCGADSVKCTVLDRVFVEYITWLWVRAGGYYIGYVSS